MPSNEIALDNFFPTQLLFELTCDMLSDDWRAITTRIL